MPWDGDKGRTGAGVQRESGQNSASSEWVWVGLVRAPRWIAVSFTKMVGPWTSLSAPLRQALEGARDLELNSQSPRPQGPPSQLGAQTSPSTSSFTEE